MKTLPYENIEGMKKINLGCATVLMVSILAIIIGLFIWPIGLMIFLVGLIMPFFKKFISGKCPKCGKEIIADEKKDSVKCNACKIHIIIDQNNKVFKYIE